MKQSNALVYLTGIWLSACSGTQESAREQTVSSADAALSGSLAVGTIPAGLPARLEVGLFEGPGETWMKSSGVPWDVRYQYFTKGWVNNWGWGSNDGGWGLSYMNECASQGFIPAVSYYQMNGEPGGSEAQFLAKVQSVSTMASYFGDFKILLQRAKEFNKPLLIMIEPDGYGFLEQQTANNPNAYAAVKDSGLAELSALPNTVAGWGLAFLALRKSVGASNVRLGMHISGWASGKDIAYGSVTDALGPEVDKVYNFLAPAGLASNVTGATYDFLVGDPLDRDSDYYKLVQGQDRWWDASDTASISSKSFNRYAEWLRLWNVKARQRWVLWQIPLGNSNHKNVYNNGASGEGYRDNRPEYFFRGDTTHLAKFADAGVVALLFGAGASGMSSYQNDTYTDGQLFMKSRAGAFLKAGGLPLATSGSGGSGSGGSGSGGSGSGGASNGSGGTTGSGGASSTTTLRYDFESNAQGWQGSGAPITSVASSTTQAASGTHSLAVQFNGAAGSPLAFVASPTAPAGAKVNLKVWLPAGSAITAIQPFVLQGASGGWTWTSSWQAIGSLKTNAWNTVSVTIPSNAVTPLYQLGVQFTTNARWTGTAYIDAVSW
jgi:hypothetical protein